MGVGCRVSPPPQRFNRSHSPSRRQLAEAPASGAARWRLRLHEVIFEADTPAGKAFDIGLLLAITLSVVVVCAESVSPWRERYGEEFRAVEWGLTGLFTIEYLLRLIAVQRPWQYARSFFGIVDLLSILPAYLSLFVTGAHSLAVIRALRLLRVFRVLKMMRFLSEARLLHAALRASVPKILVFIGAVLTIVLIAGSLLYVVEGPSSGFTSIPLAIYWAIVTMTTVGFGDIVPATAVGRFIASALMIVGYGILAVPTGIVSVELAEATRLASNTQSCPTCGEEGHANDARFCKRCGSRLNQDGSAPAAADVGKTPT